MQIQYESVAYRPEESIAYYAYHGPRIICPYHQHVEHEIAWIERSEGSVLIGDSMTEFRSGDLFLLGSGLPHLFWNHECTREARTVVIQFKFNGFGESFFQSPEMRDISQLLMASSRGLRWNLEPKANMRLRRLLREFNQQHESKRVIHFLEILHHLAKMVPDATLSSIAYEQSLNGLDSTRMNAVSNYVRKQLYSPINQSEAARLAGMSIASFRRFFRRTTHRSFPRFVNELRISEVCRLLVTTDLTVTEVLYKCGFRNHANFYRRFREIQGMPPEAYRMKLRSI